jgi:hypothetical protein
MGKKKLEPISKIVDHFQEQGMSRRKSAVRLRRMSILIRLWRNNPPESVADYWGLDAFLR